MSGTQTWIRQGVGWLPGGTDLGVLPVLERPRIPASPWETVRIGEACTACGACLSTCPERALRRAPKRPTVIDAACTGCWECIEICPAGAIVEAILPLAASDPGSEIQP